MFQKIGTKILVLFVLNVILWVSVLGVFFYYVAARSLEEQLDSALQSTAAVLAAQWDGSVLLALKPGMEQASLYRTFQERLQLLKQKTQVEAIYIATLDSTGIISSDSNLRIGQPIPRLDLLKAELTAARSGRIAASRLIRVRDRNYKSALAPVYAGNRVAAVLMIDMSPSYLVYLNSFRNSLIGFTLIALIGCIVSAKLLSRSITNPVSAMVQRVEEIGKAEYEQPLQVSGTDELAALGASIESMRKNILHRDLQMKMMLSGIAHEIRNPLGGMELFAGILEKEELNDLQKQYVAKIKSEIHNLKQLLNEFLEYGRPRKLELANVATEDLMSEIRTLMEKDIEEKRALWNLRIESEAQHVCADRPKLKQALLNIYKNAFQSVPPEGTVESVVRKNGSGLIIEIANSQRGRIMPEIAAKMFEPFFTTKEKGIGLGLPLARTVIEAHGGQLNLTENTDSRATFCVHLPSKETA